MISVAKRAVILIVEDEWLIGMNAVEMIEEAGFEVVEAASADEAIVVLEGRLDIRVVFTDIQMPGSMNGLKLAAAVRGRWPPINIIATSGHYAIRGGDLPEGRDIPSKAVHVRQNFDCSSRTDRLIEPGTGASVCPGDPSRRRASARLLRMTA